jgi:hypothetical protein
VITCNLGFQADKVISEQQLGWNWFPPTSYSELFSIDFEDQAPEQATTSKATPPRNLSNRGQYSETTRKVLDLICDEFGFLVRLSTLTQYLNYWLGR